MRSPRLRPLLAVLALLLLLPAPPAGADAKVPGEADALTPEVRAAAQKHVDAIVAAKEAKDGEKAQRALLVLGPVVWPVVENALRLGPPEAARARFHFLKALLAKKAEPEFEHLRQRLRLKLLGGALSGVRDEVVEFRSGRPDPADPRKRVPPSVAPKTQGTATVYRSADGSIVLAFAADGTAAKPDAGPVSLDEPTAGFVAAIGGRAQTRERASGGGSDVTVTAPLGFAYAYASDGAPGAKGGGDGGQGGAAEARGGAGQWGRSGTGGAGGPP
jgi:hypothetical protein